MSFDVSVRGRECCRDVQLGFEEDIVNGTPFVRHRRDIYPKLGDLSKTAAEMAEHARDRLPEFVIYRMILQKPGTVAELRELLEESYGDRNWEFSDPYTFFDLYKRYREGERPAQTP